MSTHFATSRFGNLAAAITVIITLLFGGAVAELGWLQLIVITVALLAGSGVLASSGMQNLVLPQLVIFSMISMLALPLIQLIPLPPEIWRALPGRAAETAIIQLAGGSNLWRPIALSPIVNLQLFASLVALILFSLTVARLDRESLKWLILIVLGVGLIQVVIGTVQFTTAGASFDFFGNSHKGWLLGTFANRNHAGLFFACCILISAALFNFKGRASSGAAPVFERVIFFAAIPIWMLAAIGTGSRTGFMLALIAMAMAAAIGLRGVKLPTWVWLTGSSGFLAVITAVATSNQIKRLVERYDAVGDDQRWSIWQNSVDIIASYMPWGSGFGSFVGVYNKSESLDELIPTYVNNAHNDYLELLVEAGLPGAAVLALIAILVGIGVVRGVRSIDPEIARSSLVGGGIVLLFAVHSVVDYPARRMSMALILFFAFGLLLRQFAVRIPTGTSR